jgi:hypothetical protein
MTCKFWAAGCRYRYQWSAYNSEAPAEAEETYQNDGNRELFDTVVEPTTVCRSSVISVNDELRGYSVDESVEDVGDIRETLLTRLGNESTDERESDGCFRVQVESIR